MANTANNAATAGNRFVAFLWHLKNVATAASGNYPRIRLTITSKGI